MAVKQTIERGGGNRKKRTALLIRCSADEAETLRSEAAAERRTVSSYVLNIVFRSIRFEDKLFQLPKVRCLITLRYHPAPGPRTAILVRCSRSEADAIRNASRRRETSISGYVVHALRLSWLAKKNGSSFPPLGT